MKISQIRVGADNFSYLISCEATKKAAIVDPGTNASEAMKAIGKDNLELLWIINTHFHSDHTAENLRLKEIYGCGIIASAPDSDRLEDVAMKVSDGDTLQLGLAKLEFILTPGHTPGSMCVLADSRFLMTGDTLFIGDCGRTDMPGGSDRDMFLSLQKLKSLPDKTILYPGHDYGDIPFDTIQSQKLTNKTLKAKTLEELCKIA
ncbi:MAG: hydroxyacylglutathione hydrolase family protein [Thermoplasmata archaeon]|nr:hydroxyacylglutathione hydrolase family protein [Thermoplasmata archaeon]